MPFVGNVANSGNEQIAVAQTTRNQSFLGVVNNAQVTTRVLDITALGHMSLLVTQTAGDPGSFQMFVRTQGNVPNIAYPPIAIGAINVPVFVPFPISARAAVIRFTAAAIGNNANVQISAMAAASS